MQAPMINVNDSMLLGAIKRHYQRNEISLEQYATSLRRSLVEKKKPEVMTNTIEAPPQEARPKPSEVFISLLDELGVDYVN